MQQEVEYKIYKLRIKPCKPEVNKVFGIVYIQWLKYDKTCRLWFVYNLHLELLLPSNAGVECTSMYGITSPLSCTRPYAYLINVYADWLINWHSWNK